MLGVAAAGVVTGMVFCADPADALAADSDTSISTTVPVITRRSIPRSPTVIRCPLVVPQ